MPFYGLALYCYYHGIVQHSGITFKARRWQPWQPDCMFHDNHHQYCHVNYGFNCYLWDKVWEKRENRVDGEGGTRAFSSSRNHNDNNKTHCLHRSTDPRGRPTAVTASTRTLGGPVGRWSNFRATNCAARSESGSPRTRRLTAKTSTRTRCRTAAVLRNSECYEAEVVTAVGDCRVTRLFCIHKLRRLYKPTNKNESDCRRPIFFPQHDLWPVIIAFNIKSSSLTYHAIIITLCLCHLPPTFVLWIFFPTCFFFFYSIKWIITQFICLLLPSSMVSFDLWTVLRRIRCCLMWEETKKKKKIIQFSIVN